MLPAPEGSWGMPAEMVAALPGYGTDVEKSRAEARKIMAGLGYGPGNPLKLKVATRNIPLYRDPAVILIDQLKQIHVDGELDPIEPINGSPRVARGDYSVGLNLTAAALDDPDVNFYENYACGSERNYTNYCNPAVDKLIDQQSLGTLPDRSSCRASPAYPGSPMSRVSCSTTTASTTTGASTTSGWRSNEAWMAGSGRRTSCFGGFPRDLGGVAGRRPGRHSGRLAADGPRREQGGREVCGIARCLRPRAILRPM
jgi:hypothetical protein